MDEPSMDPPRRLRLPTGVRRAVFRLPILVYRARLGWVFGKRLVLIEHQGRRTGMLRRVVVEVVTYDRATGAVTVASGFGPRADWYRNLLARPHAHMVLGARRAPVTAVPLTAEEGEEVMADYARRHPRFAALLARYLAVPRAEAEGYRAVGRRLPYVRLEPDRPRR